MYKPKYSDFDDHFYINYRKKAENIILRVKPLKVARYILDINRSKFKLPILMEKSIENGLEIIFEESVTKDTLLMHIETFTRHELNNVVLCSITK